MLRTPYTPPALTTALSGHDAVVCLLGPAGMSHQPLLIRAAHAARVRRFILSDFGWGPTARGLPEFGAVQAQRREGWDLAARLAEDDGEGGFSWTGISSGNPVDWALGRFPTMGFDVGARRAVIYDEGVEAFSGTTLEGIGRAVVGVLRREEETRNRFVRVMSLMTCQRELLGAFEEVTAVKWEVERSSTRELLERGREKMREGKGGWTLDLAVAQLFDEGQGRCLVAPSWEESDSELVGVKKESAVDIVKTVMASRQ